MKYFSIILILLSISLFSQTQIKENQIKDNAITRNKLNADSTGKAVIKRLFAVSPLSVTSSGVDTGTGDVTIEIDTSSIYNKIDTKLNITDTTNFRTFSNNRYLLTDSITATNNYITKISTSKKLVNSIIQDDGTNLGIGTTTNSNYKINVSGFMNITNTNIDQESYPTINVTQEAKLHQTLGNTGVDETLSSLWIAQR